MTFILENGPRTIHNQIMIFKQWRPNKTIHDIDISTYMGYP